MKKIKEHLQFANDIFEKVEVCENVIKQYGEKADCFMVYRPRHVFIEMPLRLYEKHCEELAKRMVNNKDVGMPTKAEILFALLNTALISPIKWDYHTLAEALFYDLLPDEAKTLGITKQHDLRDLNDVIEDSCITLYRWTKDRQKEYDKLKK